MDPKEYLEQVEKKYPGPKEFVHLHNHTIFSPLDGVATPDEYFDLCVCHDMPAFAITDHGNLAGIPDAYFASQRTGKKFIAGCEVYFNDYHNKFLKLKEHGVTIGEIKAKNPELRDRIVRNRHLTVIAMDSTGYENLVSIMHTAWEKGFYYRPRIWFDEIAKHSDGLIVLSGCLNGPVCHELRHGNYEAGIKWIKKLRGVFKDRFYLEFQMPGEEIEGGKDAFKILSILSREMNIPGVISNDCLEGDYPILMADGFYKPIKDVNIGDEVISTSGKLRKIINKGKRKRRPREKTYKVNNIPWSMTENHRLYHEKNGITRFNNSRPHDVPIEWSFAGNKPPHGQLFMLQLPVNKLNEIDVKEYVNINVRGRKIEEGVWRTVSPITQQTSIPEFLEVDDEFLWVLGNYVAEGYKDQYRISFAAHKKEKNTHQRIINYFEQFGFNPDYNEKRTNSENGCVLRICSAVFSELFSNLCGKLAHNKHLPNFWMSLNKDQAKIMLEGYIAGDGSYKNGAFSWASTSWQLTGQLMTLISSLGGYARPYFKPEKQVTESRIDKEQYWGRCGQKAKNMIFEGSPGELKGIAKSVYDEEWMTVPLKWEETEYDGYVYDIEVEEDHTFVLWGNIESSNCHYATRKEFELQMVMMATSQRTTVDDPELFHVNSDEQFFKTRAELRKTFIEDGYTEYMTIDEFETLCNNTVKLADRCTGFKPNLESKLPNFVNDSSTLKTIVTRALADKGLHEDERYVERMKLELDRIVSKEFASYFLITKDLCDFSRSQDFMNGPARGSAGGSLVCYLLGIHQLDPIKFKLSFDRFLSESRGGDMLRVRMD